MKLRVVSKAHNGQAFLVRKAKTGSFTRHFIQTGGVELPDDFASRGALYDYFGISTTDWQLAGSNRKRPYGTGTSNTRTTGRLANTSQTVLRSSP